MAEPRGVAETCQMLVDHQFAGHFHRWLLAMPDMVTGWCGEEPVTLAELQRSFGVIGALCEGRFATFDTDTCELIPLQCSGI